MNVLTRVCLLAVVVALNARVDIKESLLEEFFALTYDKKILQEVMDPLLDQLAQGSNIAAADVEVFKKKVLERYLGELKPAFLKVYGREFTEKDLKKLVAFHKSPVAQKMRDKQIAINKELMQVFGLLTIIASQVAAEYQPQEVIGELPLIKVTEAEREAIVHFDKSFVSKYSSAHTAPELFNDLTNAAGIVVVKFSASWCNPCRIYAPIFEAVASKYHDIIHEEQSIPVHYIAVDVDAFPALAKQCKVGPVPTTIVYRDGIVQETIVGKQDEETLIKKIENVARQ